MFEPLASPAQSSVRRLALCVRTCTVMATDRLLLCAGLRLHTVFKTSTRELIFQNKDGERVAYCLMSEAMIVVPVHGVAFYLEGVVV